YSEFDYYFYGTSAYTNNYWSLTWRNPEDYSYIEVNLDKDNNFTYYSHYDRSESGKNIPSYLKMELRDEAEDFIKQIAPDVYKNIEYVDSNYNGIYSNTYTYSFQRKENGIIFPDNNVSIRVNADSGKVTYANIEWLHDAKIPSADTKLTKDEAADIISKNLNMKLTYKTNYYRIYENGQNEYVKKAFLVYEPDISYISIDANSGEVYLTRSEWVERTSNDVSEEMAKDMGVAEADGGATLTEEELEKIRELEKLITKEKAIEIVTTNPYLHIDDNLITYTAYLNKNYFIYNKNNENTYVWNISLRDERPVDYSKNEDNYRAYASATVDAKTGKILSFYASIKNNYDSKTGKWLPVSIKYDKEYGQKIFEEFLKEQAKERFENTKLVEQREDYIAYYKDDIRPVYGGYGYRYNRFNEGVEFPYNGINGAVDGVTGKIYNYNINWDDDIEFESPKNAMSPEDAFKHYISKDGYNLLYEINVINMYDPNYKSKDRYYDYSEAYSVAYEIRLVYRPDIYPTYISPFTGEQLNGSGEVYKVTGPYKYKDIPDTPNNRNILLLADMNIGFEGDEFKPDLVITESELIKLFENLGYWTPIEESKSSSTVITREELAKIFINKLGLEKIASLKGIYTTGYADEDKIKPNYLGAVALSKGLDLFPDVEDNFFNPKDYINRREAVNLLLNYVAVENSYIY
ncbi:MAG: hypothetical protein GX321_02220, partial [Clostridiales bacterium]|nr:hypothetical protein [Clostridiales bacterium]